MTNKVEGVENVTAFLSALVDAEQLTADAAKQLVALATDGVTRFTAQVITVGTKQEVMVETDNRFPYYFPLRAVKPIPQIDPQ